MIMVRALSDEQAAWCFEMTREKFITFINRLSDEDLGDPQDCLAARY